MWGKIFLCKYIEPRDHEDPLPETHLKSCPMGMPPSWSMGVISSPRYTQMWGTTSRAKSSAPSRISRSLWAWTTMASKTTKSTQPCIYF